MTPIWLFGPPGSGKSTLISELAARGERAFDLEGLAATHAGRVRGASATLGASWDAHRVWIGAADLSVDEARSASLAARAEVPLTFLLLPHRQAYIARREARDLLHPRKANQDGDAVYDGFARAATRFDLSFNTGGLTVFNTVERLLALANEKVRVRPSLGGTPPFSGATTMHSDDNKPPLPPSPQRLTPLAAPIASLVGAIWVTEEMGELADAASKGDVMGTVDAILDGLGIILELMALPEIARAMGPGYKGYVASQLRRGRSMRNAHQVVMAKLLHDWPLIARDKLTPEEIASAAREFFAHRANRGLPEQLRDSSRLLRDTASRLKAAARSKESASDELDLALMTKASRDRENSASAPSEAAAPVGTAISTASAK